MYINYDKNGKILGYYESHQENDFCTKLTYEQYIESQRFNKIVIKEDKISFEKVDWRTEEEINIERINKIKQKAGEIIKSKYSIVWQLNHPRLDTTYINEYAWLDNIRKISNEAELNGIALEDIDWNILDSFEL